MKVLVCGGRHYHDRDHVWKVLSALRSSPQGVDMLIHGGAPGADQHAQVWAMTNHVPDVQVLPDWNAYGKAAGPIRNQQMLDEHKPDIVVAFPGGKGTADMVKRAKAAGVPVSLEKL